MQGLVLIRLSVCLTGGALIATKFHKQYFLWVDTPLWGFVLIMLMGGLAGGALIAM